MKTVEQTCYRALFCIKNCMYLVNYSNSKLIVNYWNLAASLRFFVLNNASLIRKFSGSVWLWLYLSKSIEVSMNLRQVTAKRTDRQIERRTTPFRNTIAIISVYRPKMLHARQLRTVEHRRFVLKNCRCSQSWQLHSGSLLHYGCFHSLCKNGTVVVGTAASNAEDRKSPSTISRQLQWRLLELSANQR